ncbi:MAG: hypothetical protein KatS3mg111_3597 [Pirellulaceae bacterium]|nr:MAG: hypothetical protein KatS3mg111_3597 [Pirellulaceae bacterium]
MNLNSAIESASPPRNNRAADRRQFLKQAALAAATGVAARRAQAVPLPIVQSPDTETDEAGVTWQKAPCRFCGTGCHVRVGTLDGRVVAIQGDQAAEVNKGLLCVKGYHVGAALYGKDRLTHPMRRQGRFLGAYHVGGSHRHHRAADHGGTGAIRHLRLRSVDHPGGICGPKIHEGWLVQ